MANMLRPGQFSLKSLFIATTFIALECALVGYAANGHAPMGRVLAILGLPLVTMLAVAILRRRIKPIVVLWMAMIVALQALILCLLIPA
jgi:hypothetical protein